MALGNRRDRDTNTALATPATATNSGRAKPNFQTLLGYRYMTKKAVP